MLANTYLAALASALGLSNVGQNILALSTDQISQYNATPSAARGLGAYVWRTAPERYLDILESLIGVFNKCAMDAFEKGAEREAVSEW